MSVSEPLHEVKLRYQGIDMLRSVKYLLWDLDGTLYRSDPDLLNAIQREIYMRMATVLSIPYQEAKKRFLTVYARLGGATATVVELGLDRSLIQEAVDSVDKGKYVKPDPKLRDMFESELRTFNHIIVTNTSREGTVRTLEVLGLSQQIFQGIVTADDVLRPKPDVEPYLKALEITGGPVHEHVSIGDREKVDILPAKRLGMKTILVWGTSEAADASVPTVYDVPKVLHRISQI
jgi:HAD superfamily hydrolase (TIGR01549 family)